MGLLYMLRDLRETQSIVNGIEQPLFYVIWLAHYQIHADYCKKICTSSSSRFCPLFLFQGDLAKKKIYPTLWWVCSLIKLNAKTYTIYCGTHKLVTMLKL